MEQKNVDAIAIAVIVISIFSTLLLLIAFCIFAFENLERKNVDTLWIAVIVTSLVSSPLLLLAFCIFAFEYLIEPAFPRCCVRLFRKIHRVGFRVLGM